MGMNDLVELTRKLAEVTAEVAGDFVLMLKCEAVIIAQRTRIAQLEALLPCAYRAGVEDVCRCKTYEPDCYQGQESMDKVPDGRWLDIDEIRAQPTPTSVELLARFKDKNDE